MSNKRSRASEETITTSSRSPTPSPSRTPTLKAQRLAPIHGGHSNSPPLLCTLPPTCDPPRNAPTALRDANDLERHYALYHAHVCTDRTCGAVFPDERLLELHFTECHDPLAMVRKERGEKIFACHLPSCQKMFLDPKKRRMHLIQAHGFPKEYFFAVTNKGVGGLLRRWGEGASLLRKPWKAREGQAEEIEEAGGMEVETESTESGEEDQGHGADEKEHIDFEMMSTSASSTIKTTGAGPDKELEKLTDSLGSLSLIPTSIHFGRSRPQGMERRPQNRDTRQPRGKPADPPTGKNAPASAQDGATINIDGALNVLKEDSAVLTANNTSSSPRGRQDEIIPSPVSKQGRGRGGGRGRGKGRPRGAPPGRVLYVPS